MKLIPVLKSCITGLSAGFPCIPEIGPAGPSGGPLLGGKVMIMGTGLEPSAIRAMVEKCGRGGMAGGGGDEGRPLRTVASVTPAERAAIAEVHKFDDLPEGCCFDGSRYRDEFGDVLRDHPYMDR